VGGDTTLTWNQWHNHSWFPLYCNYFAGRYGNDPLANTYFCSDFMTYTEYNNPNPAVLELCGVRLNLTSTNSRDYAFGYCDAHANGTHTSTAVNPYNPSTSRGDPIDISWAVDANGNPVSLSNIRYVRVYTGISAMNPTAAFGEVSTEVTGVYKAAGDNTGTPSSPAITIGGYTLAQLQAQGILNAAQNVNMGVINVDSSLLAAYLGSSTTTVSATGATNTYINSTNGTALTNVSVANHTLVRIIAQSGDAEPYVVLLKFVP
jgi:hypothetical protein